MLTRYILPIAVAAGTLVLSSVGSQALPVAKPTASPSQIERVGWRCGPRWHMNRWGRCVPNRHHHRWHRRW
ncbi:GCG_CRPN prefix-to-repeats domain-containing protein [Mesorhizobium erdmanii]|uniref:GCG_CRPN prefix-to-repeats domain-containing protein n=1 Tax=Mesorhizobium erdmanii TaxID=1777866 RepID=UPI003CCD9CA2